MPRCPNTSNLVAAGIGGLLLCFTMLPANGNAAISEDNFLLRTTGDLVELCKAAPTDPYYTAAINFSSLVDFPWVFTGCWKPKTGPICTPCFASPSAAPPHRGDRGLRPMGRCQSGSKGHGPGGWHRGLHDEAISLRSQQAEIGALP